MDRPARFQAVVIGTALPPLYVADLAPGSNLVSVAQ